ncbi:molybdenum cofactor guanylyltransferase [Natronosalvus vescus]|uniref:molybdenum cofactor guanylyltransferase n=1 Tax=Natronosalvus vescus TaxID=2953881 RepID=UPI00209029E2|nr:molybdenum cofactor guanylyltransferase [Natronosalvus vescus]
MTDPERAGVILAGGFSTRFGESDKAVADLQGTPMVARVAERVACVTDELVVNCRAEQVEVLTSALEELPVDYRFAVDPTPDLGPLAGILAGLEAAEAPLSAVVACDMPFVDPHFLAFLFEVAEGETTVAGENTESVATEPAAVVPKLEDGWYQTTQAVYQTEPMATACMEALEADEGKILAALDRLEWVVVKESAVLEHTTLETFDSIDTQADLETARER